MEEYEFFQCRSIIHSEIVVEAQQKHITFPITIFQVRGAIAVIRYSAESVLSRGPGSYIRYVAPFRPDVCTVRRDVMVSRVTLYRLNMNKLKQQDGVIQRS